MRKHKAPIAFAVSFAAAGTLWMGGTANADDPVEPLGSSCSAVGCSATTNSSPGSVYVVRDWTCTDGTTGTLRTGCVSLTHTKWIAANGGRTPANEDWDAVRVDAGYCYRLKFDAPLQSDWRHTYSRVGQSTPGYIKVENAFRAIVEAQRYGACP
ncbi:hypothetical protein [Sphaerisporangium sp. TRM90804]|uniref:hypothetical protein n=1 Tax=Sphaerisporangium sp. TRM90804 TaxID=3031113 RepID=UPI00244A1814|nr:hypothetical protein [Sphaerisporangium sp. TRM90804]MDH2424924.1 hypothetical protein [Sphaerisporangium sp. TRM90804]